MWSAVIRVPRSPSQSKPSEKRRKSEVELLSDMRREQSNRRSRQTLHFLIFQFYFWKVKELHSPFHSEISLVQFDDENQLLWSGSLIYS